MNQSTPVYRRIADSLRQRIESGQLRAGDRVPSTRALARKWGVALATAAHAQSALAAEGWIRTLPRVGAIVTGPSSRPEAPRSQPPSMRTRIIGAAVAIADSEGLPSLSLRGVAARLETPVTSLYRHVESKEALLQLMTDAVLAEGLLPAQRPVGWRDQLELAARLEWSVLGRHPWLARVMSITRPKPLTSSLAYADWVLGALDQPGLGARLRMQMHILLHAFIQGMAVNLESEADAASETGLSDTEWMDTQVGAFTAFAATGRYPAFAAVLSELAGGFELDMNALFELGLRSLLDGFARLIDAPEPLRRQRALRQKA